MTKAELVAKLKEVAQEEDPEAGHSWADSLLLKFINDPEVTEAYNSIKKWYA